MMFFPFSASQAVLLIALGFGYIVCYLANREEGILKRSGNLIGIFIIALSIILIIANIQFSVLSCTKMGGMFKRHQMMMRGQPGSPPAMQGMQK